MKTAFLISCATLSLAFTSLSRANEASESSAPPRSATAPSIVVPVTEEPGHIVRYRSPRFIIYTNHFAPGDWTLYHQHRKDLLAVIAGETVAINQKLGGEPGEQRVPAGTVAFFPYADLPDGYAHRVSVGGNKPFINIGIDFQDTVPGAERRAMVPTWNDAAVKLISDNRRGRAYRLELAAGQSIAFPGGDSALLVVALTGATMSLAIAGSDAALWQTTPGEFKFFETTRPQRIGNSSSSAASLIVFQAY